MLNILTGPEVSGLSHLLCEEMIRASLEAPDDLFLIIVPEQSTLRMQRMVVENHPRHAVMNIDIVSFERLAHKVFEELGFCESDILNDTGKVLILRKILEESREDLVLYRRKVHMPGFAQEMNSSVTELKQYGIDDNELFLMQEAAKQEGNRTLFSKLQDIRLIYRRFNEAVSERYTTQEEVLEVFARLVSQSELIRGTHIYLDGFTGFTPVQYRLILELLKYSAGVCASVVIPGKQIGSNEQDDQFFLSNTTIRKLRETAEKAGTGHEVLTAKIPLTIPEGFYFRGENCRDEVLFIAGEILQEVRAGKKRFRDFTIICSDMERYHFLFRQIFSQAGIPCFIDHKTELGDNELARFLVAAMHSAAEHFSFDSVFAFLKSGLSDLDPDEICHLENYCLEFGIRGISSWKKDFTRNRLLRKDPEKKENNRYFWDLPEINEIRKKAAGSLAAFYTACSGERTAREYSVALKQLLLSVRAEEKMSRLSEIFYQKEEMSKGKEYEQIFSLVTSLLDQIADLMGKEKISAREYAQLLEGALEEIRVGIIPPSLDAVTVGDLTRTRIGDVKVLFLAGANEGKLPAPAAHAGLLTRQEREFLRQEKFELAPTVLEHLFIQHFYLYLALTRPRERVFLTYAGELEGEELVPSYVIKGIEEILPGMELKEIQAAPDTLWTSKASLELARSAKDPSMLSDEQKEVLRYFFRRDQRILKQIFSGAFYNNRALALDEQTAADLYGEVLKGSVSRYESFYECPFRHFLDYGLRLEERPEFKVQAADIGTLYHESLERYSRKLAEHGVTFRNVTDEQSDDLAVEAVQEAAQDLEKEVLTDSSRNTYLLGRIAEVTRKTADVLRMQVNQGLYEPEYFEMAFSEDSDEHTKFLGKIDRVDIYDGNDLYVKVIDYKSGSKKFSIHDIYTGQQMQLTAYLTEAVKKVKHLHPDRQVKAGGVYYYLIQDRYVGDEEEAAKKFRMSGLTNCAPEALHAIDTDPGPSKESSIAEFKFTGSGLHASSKVANDGEFEHLMAFVEQKILDAGRRVREGETSVCPAYENPQKNACIYCRFRDICKFEPGKWGSDYRKLPEELDKKEMEREIYGR